MARAYLIVSACRDEERFAELTIASVVNQVERPAKWIIVDDGSMDRTPEVLAQARKAHGWIETISLPRRESRLLGSGVIRAFNVGLASTTVTAYDYISKLDLDLVLPPSYYADLMDRMEQDERLGTASGRPFVASGQPGVGARWEAERGSFEMSAGMAKLYRRDTFMEIGGLVEEIMWDGIDCHQARMHGWKSRSFDSRATDFRHLRPEGSSDRGVSRGRRRHGYGQWFMGSDPLFVVCSAILRIRDSPVIVGSVHMLIGFFSAALRRVERYGDQSFRSELRRFQRESLLFGKRRATRRWEARTAAVWALRHPQ